MPGYLDSFSNATWGWGDGEDNWGSPTNRTLRQIAYAGVHKAVRSVLSTPPANPAIGDSYIVGVGPTGDWSSYPENSVAVWGRDETNPLTIAWQRFQPRVGWLVYNQATSRVLVYNGASWGELQNTASAPVLVDGTSIMGDGVSTALSAHFTQAQADWADTNTASPSYIDNVPSELRNYTTPSSSVFWKSTTFSGSLTAMRTTANVTLANFVLDSQLSDMDRLNTHTSLRNMWIGARVQISFQRKSSGTRYWLALYRPGALVSSNWVLQRSPVTDNTSDAIIRVGGFTSFQIVLRAQSLSLSSDGFNYSGRVTAGLYVDS